MGSYLSFDRDLGKDRVDPVNRVTLGEPGWLEGGAGPLIPEPRNTEKLSQTDSMNCS